jgi:hypothetical protein
MGKANHEKGVRLENDFRDFMVKELGWDSAKTRAQMLSKSNNNGVNVDIIAKRKDVRGKRFMILGVVYLMLFAAVLIYGIIVNDLTILWLSALVEVLGFIFLFLSVKLNAEHAWVECKNQSKELVSNRQMSDTINELKAYKASGNKEFKFTCQYFVTSIGYSDTALKLAHDEDVICYIQKNNCTFEKVKYL